MHIYELLNDVLNMIFHYPIFNTLYFIMNQFKTLICMVSLELL